MKYFLSIIFLSAIFSGCSLFKSSDDDNPSDGYYWSPDDENQTGSNLKPLYKMNVEVKNILRKIVTLDSIQTEKINFTITKKETYKIIFRCKWQGADSKYVLFIRLENFENIVYLMKFKGSSKNEQTIELSPGNYELLYGLRER